MKGKITVIFILLILVLSSFSYVVSSDSQIENEKVLIKTKLFSNNHVKNEVQTYLSLGDIEKLQLLISNLYEAIEQLDKENICKFKTKILDMKIFGNNPSHLDNLVDLLITKQREDESKISRYDSLFEKKLIKSFPILSRIFHPIPDPEETVNKNCSILSYGKRASNYFFVGDLLLQLLFPSGGKFINLLASLIMGINHHIPLRSSPFIISLITEGTITTNGEMGAWNKSSSFSDEEFCIYMFAFTGITIDLNLIEVDGVNNPFLFLGVAYLVADIPIISP